MSCLYLMQKIRGGDGPIGQKFLKFFLTVVKALPDGFLYDSFCPSDLTGGETPDAIETKASLLGLGQESAIYEPVKLLTQLLQILKRQ